MKLFILQRRRVLDTIGKISNKSNLNNLALKIKTNLNQRTSSILFLKISPQKDEFSKRSRRITQLQRQTKCCLKAVNMFIRICNRTGMGTTCLTNRVLSLVTTKTTASQVQCSLTASWVQCSPTKICTIQCKCTTQCNLALNQCHRPCSLLMSS